MSRFRSAGEPAAHSFQRRPRGNARAKKGAVTAARRATAATAGSAPHETESLAADGRGYSRDTEKMSDWSNQRSGVSPERPFTANSKVMDTPAGGLCGAPSRTRTDTRRILSPLPLPIGLWGLSRPFMLPVTPGRHSGSGRNASKYRSDSGLLRMWSGPRLAPSVHALTCGVLAPWGNRRIVGPLS